MLVKEVRKSTMVGELPLNVTLATGLVFFRFLNGSCPLALRQNSNAIAQKIKLLVFILSLQHVVEFLLGIQQNIQ